MRSDIECRDGWLCVSYNGPELTPVEIGYGTGKTPDAWRPAFLDWVDGKRVAKVRFAAGASTVRSVWVRYQGKTKRIGRAMF